MKTKCSTIVLCLLLCGLSRFAVASEPLVHRWMEVVNSPDVGTFLEGAQELFTEELWAKKGQAGWGQLGQELIDHGGLELQGLDAVGDAWTLEGVTSDGLRWRMPLTIEDGKIASLGLAIGGSGSSSDLPAVEFAAVDDASLHDGLKMFFARSELADYSGAVLVARGSEVVFRHAGGLASRSFGILNHPGTRFDLGSINKAFTKVAIGQLHSRGKLRFDDPLIRHLPDYPNREVAERITIRQLLDHSSGLGDIFGPAFFKSSKALYRQPRDFFPLFVGQPLLFEPGTSRSYSNAGFQVLGAMIEALSGLGYDEYIRRHVFMPAGMSSTDFFARDQPVADVAIGYTLVDGEIRNNLFSLPIKGSPAGSALSTVDDMWRFDRALRLHRLLPPAYSRWFFGGGEPQTQDTSRAPAEGAIGIAGGAPGVSAVLESHGELTVICLSNFDEPGAEELGRHLFTSIREALSEAAK